MNIQKKLKQQKYVAFHILIDKWYQQRSKIDINDHS